MLQRHLRLFGRVQGVGLRWTAQRIAAEFRVDGFVKNLSDGSVQLVVSGPGDQVEGFLEALQQAMPGHFDDIRDEAPLDAEFAGFEIRY